MAPTLLCCCSKYHPHNLEAARRSSLPNTSSAFRGQDMRHMALRLYLPDIARHCYGWSTAGPQGRACPKSNEHAVR